MSIKSLATLFLVGSGVLFQPFSSSAWAENGNSFQNFTPESAKKEFIEYAKKIDDSAVSALPMQNHGRVKPFDTLARETILFITGGYSLWGMSAVQAVLGLSTSNASAYLEVINVRDPELRVKLGFKKSQKMFSMQQLAKSPLEDLAKPIMEKQERNDKSVSPDEKNVLEAMQQVWALRSVLTSGFLTNGLNLNVSPGENESQGSDNGILHQKAQSYLGALKEKQFSQASMIAMELLPLSKAQAMPDLFRKNIDKVSVEVLFNHVRPFFWTAIFYMLLGLVLASQILKGKMTRKVVFAILAVPFLMHIAGFALRVYITGFAPVTNMYGTMIWMALGVVFFGAVLYGLYQSAVVFGMLLIGGSVTLLLTESIPLVLSPDMDPIVAVLRNNFWLTIHVLTITISYAAFSISMLIGNSYFIQALLGRTTPEGTKNLAHLSYRSMQLGVFLLTAGIILGGWWADYSWGRFWGWDPKETWALIADLGFLAILHARSAGWVGPAGLLSAGPLAYLLVIMAWYGVNFILAAGLHSYGFSSGGATIVSVFVIAQLVLFFAAMGTRSLRLKLKA